MSYLILGITQEQQAQSADASVPATATTTTTAPDPVLDFDGEEFPALRKASGHVTSGTFDERFEFALDMQVTALQVELAKSARTGS
ncbi:hypothetical protein [Streptomyces sp. NPDC088794]|uniref:hypothetical protein n=1 Tax=Streptomyces sp. NPDC088794 TaxID=3365902 RepID=UPI0038274E61